MVTRGRPAPARTPRVVVPLEPLGKCGQVAQLAAARWAVELARAEGMPLLVLCPLRPPVTFGLLPDPGPLLTLHQHVESLAQDILLMVPAALTAGVRVAFQAGTGELAVLLGAVLGAGDVLVVPPEPANRRRRSTARHERRVARAVASARATTSPVGYADEAARPARRRTP